MARMSTRLQARRGNDPSEPIEPEAVEQTTVEDNNQGEEATDPNRDNANENVGERFSVLEFLRDQGGLISPDENARRLLREKVFVATLLKRIGLSNEAATYMVEEQEINSIDTMLNIDDDEIEKLCKSCRKCYSSESESKGISVPVIAESNFKLANFAIKFRDMTSRPIEPGSINIDTIRKMKDFKTELMGRTDPPIESAPAIHKDKVFEWFEAIREFLMEHTGDVSKRPLAYVVRPKEQIKESDDDPAYGRPDSSYQSYYHEIVARAPIKIINPVTVLLEDEKYYKQDNAKVWRILKAILKDTTYMPFLKKFLKTEDGRGAFMTLHEQLLGQQALNNYATKAEHRLNNVDLDGTRRRNWNFESYVTAHVEQHHIFEKLKEHGHPGLSEATKIDKFLAGIKDPSLKVPVSTVLSDFRNNDTFEKVARTLRTYVESNRAFEGRISKNRQLNVSAISATTGNRVRDNGPKPTTRSDHYDPTKNYSRYGRGIDPKVWHGGPAWLELTPNQRNFLRQHKRNQETANSSRGNDNHQHQGNNNRGNQSRGYNGNHRNYNNSGYNGGNSAHRRNNQQRRGNQYGRSNNNFNVYEARLPPPNGNEYERGYNRYRDEPEEVQSETEDFSQKKKKTRIASRD